LFSRSAAEIAEIRLWSSFGQVGWTQHSTPPPIARAPSTGGRVSLASLHDRCQNRRHLCISRPVSFPSTVLRREPYGPSRSETRVSDAPGRGGHRSHSDRTGRSTDVAVMLRVNGSVRQLQLDSRVTLLDALREHLDLIGTKKGCDGAAPRCRHGLASTNG
jgi:hypothetical protein